MIRSTDEDPVGFLDMLLEVEVVLIGVITQVTGVGPDVLMRIHVTLVAWKKGESFITNITLVKLLIIFHVNTLNVFLPLVICFKKLVTERTRKGGRFVKLHVIGKFVLRLKLLTTSCANKFWQLLVCMNNEMFLKFSRVLEAFAAFRAKTQIFLFRLHFFSLSVVFIRFSSTIDMSLFGIVPFPWYDSLVFEEHVIPEGEMVVK